MFSNVWSYFVIISICLGALAIRRLVTGAGRAGDPFMIVGSVCIACAGVIALVFDLTPVPKIATFVLAIAGGVAFLNMLIRDSRQKKSLGK